MKTVFKLVAVLVIVWAVIVWAVIVWAVIAGALYLLASPGGFDGNQTPTGLEGSQ